MKNQKHRDMAAWGLTAFITIVLCILFFFVLYKLRELHAFSRTLSAILQPISFGAVLAYVLTPIYNRVRSTLSRWLSGPLKRQRLVNSLASGGGIAASLLFIILVAYGLVAAVVPEVVRSIVGIADDMDTYFATMSNWFNEFMSRDTIYAPYIRQLLDNVGTYIENLVNDTILPNLNSYLVNLSAGVVQALRVTLNLIIGLIVAAYLLGCKDTLCAQSKKIIYGLFRTPAANLIVAKFRYAHQVFGGFINGKLLDSLIIGIIAMVFCNLLQFPYPMLLAVIIGVTNVIPFFGPFIGAIPCALLVLLVSPLQCLYFCIFILILQQFDGNILGPKILGDSTGLSSFWVLFSILLFGGLFGFVGMIVGVPLFAVFYSLVKDFIGWRLGRKDLSQDTDDYRGLYAITDRGYEYRAQKGSPEPQERPGSGEDSARPGGGEP